MTIMKSINLMPATTRTSYNEFHMCLHEPVISATAFGMIFRTPIHHTPFSHDNCTAPDWECAKDTVKPLLRAPETVRFFWLAEGAKLVDTDTLGQEPKWTTPIRLEDASFVEPLMMNKEKAAHVDTVMELLKSADRHEDKRYLRALDRKLSLGEDWRT